MYGYLQKKPKKRTAKRERKKGGKIIPNRKEGRGPPSDGTGGWRQTKTLMYWRSGKKLKN